MNTEKRILVYKSKLKWLFISGFICGTTIGIVIVKIWIKLWTNPTDPSITGMSLITLLD